MEDKKRKRQRNKKFSQKPPVPIEPEVFNPVVQEWKENRRRRDVGYRKITRHKKVGTGTFKERDKKERAALRKSYNDCEYYVTPITMVDDFLEAFTEDFPNVFENKQILDPTAGGTTYTEMPYPFALRKYTEGKDSRVITVDIREDSRAKIIGDYLALDFKDKYDIIITSPPVKSLLHILKKALDEVKEGGYVIFLMKLRLANSKRRREIFRKYPLAAVYVHDKTPATGMYAQHSNDFAHFVWQKGKKDFNCIFKLV